MADPRKPTKAVSGAEAQRAARLLHLHLMSCTDNAAQDLGCTGVSVVTMGIGIWAVELAELDPAATGWLLRALADLVDPRATPASRAAAENRRAYAARKLHQALDTRMARPVGTA